MNLIFLFFSVSAKGETTSTVTYSYHESGGSLCNARFMTHFWI